MWLPWLHVIALAACGCLGCISKHVHPTQFITTMLPFALPYLHKHIPVHNTICPSQLKIVPTAHIQSINVTTRRTALTMHELRTTPCAVHVSTGLMRLVVVRGCSSALWHYLCTHDVFQLLDGLLSFFNVFDFALD